MATKKGNRKPVLFVKNPDNDQTVDGLRYHKTTGRYYRIENGRKVYYKKRGNKGIAYLRRAILEHQCIAEGRELPSSAFIEVNEPVYDQFGGEINPIATVDDKGMLVNGMYVPLTAIYNWVHDQIANPETRFDFATNIRIPEIAHLDKLRPSEIAPTLTDIGAWYFNKRNEISYQALLDAKRYWAEFVDVVTVERASEITPQHMHAYADEMFYRRERDSRKPRWITRRFSQITTIFSHSLTRGIAAEELQRVLTLCKILVPPKNGRKPKPKPISKKHYRSILDATKNSKYKAIWLCMLNFAMKPSEIVYLYKEDFDFKRGVLVSDRHKTGNTRVGVVWQQTKTAIELYCKKQPHNHPQLFVTDLGEPWSVIRGGRGITEEFQKLRALCKIPDEVKCEHIRDGAYTAAIEGGADLLHAKLLAGHVTGISDDYVRRNPSMVSDACQAIEKHYFGK